MPELSAQPRNWNDFDASNGKLTSWRDINHIDAVLGGLKGDVPPALAFPCWDRLQELRRTMHATWKGCNDAIDMLLATMIARENVLLIGPPGGAKSEIIT